MFDRVVAKEKLVPRGGDEARFLKDNFLSNDKRYPLTKIETKFRTRVRDKRQSRSHLGQLFPRSI